MIDPTIALNVKPPQVNDPLEQAGRAMNLLAARQQIQMAPLRMQVAQQELEQGRLVAERTRTAIEEEKAFKEAVARGAKPAELLQVAPTLAVPHFKQLLDQDKAKIEQAKGKAALLSNALGGVKYAPEAERPSRYAAVRADAIAKGIITPEEAPEQYDPAFVDQKFRAAIDADKQIDDHQKELDFQQRVLSEAPKTAKEWNDLVLREGSAAKSQAELDQTRARLETLGVPKAMLARALPAMWSETAMNDLAKRAVPVEKRPDYEVDSMKARLGIMGNSEYDQFLAAYAQKLGKAPAALSPDEKLKSFTEFAEAKKDPVMRGLAIAQGNLANALKQMQLDQMPTKEQAALLADDIVNHRLAPDQISQIRGRGNGSLGLMVYAEAKKKDPSFNWEEASSTYALAKSPAFQNTVRYMDSVSESIPLVIDRAKTLANGNVRSVNALLNAGRNQFNDVDVKRFQTDALLVADEIAKILQGGGTGSGTSDAKLKQAGEILNQSDSPAAIAAALGDVKELIGFRRKALTRGTYMENATPEKAPAAGGSAPKTAADYLKSIGGAK